ncbi:MAG: DMT family transporter [Gammaproteobacteria bacterium]|nr:DMT family transporter [Gammaproteobacteria bacterium]
MNETKVTKINYIKRAVILGIIASFFYSIMSLLVKLVSNESTESMTVFFRFSVSMFWVILVLIYKKLRNKPFTLKTKHLRLHVLRAVSAFVAMFTLYYALRYVPLADASSLSMTYTLFIPIFSFIFFGTKTSAKSWLALITGFIGIVLILKPFNSNFNPMILMALISSVAIALSFLGIYELAKHDEPYTIMFYFFPLTVILSGIAMIFSWKTPDLSTLTTLLMIGITGTIYQDLIMRAMSYAPTKIIAPLLYFGIIFSGVFDWLFWHHIPGLYFWAGASLIIGGCVFSIRYSKD